METRRIHKEDRSVRDVWLTPVAGKLWDGGGFHNALLRSAVTAPFFFMLEFGVMPCREKQRSPVYWKNESEGYDAMTGDRLPDQDYVPSGISTCLMPLDGRPIIRIYTDALTQQIP